MLARADGGLEWATTCRISVAPRVGRLGVDQGPLAATPNGAAEFGVVERAALGSGKSIAWHEKVARSGHGVVLGPGLAHGHREGGRRWEIPDEFEGVAHARRRLVDAQLQGGRVAAERRRPMRVDNVIVVGNNLRKIDSRKNPWHEPRVSKLGVDGIR